MNGKFEYLELNSPTQADLDDAGLNGWELVSVNSTKYTFKRKKK